MKLLNKITLLLTLFFVSFGYSYAQDSLKLTKPVIKKPSDFRLLIKGALEFGGDEVAKVYFTNGKSQSVNAGQGGSIAVGTEYRVPGEERLRFQASIGYKYVTTQADNAHIRLTRVPMQFTANWMAAPQFRIGAGVVSHQAIHFNAGGLGDNISYKSASGPVFELAYGVAGLSYTAMSYKDDTNTSYSANAVSFSFTFTLPNR